MMDRNNRKLDKKVSTFDLDFEHHDTVGTVSALPQNHPTYSSAQASIVEDAARSFSAKLMVDVICEAVAFGVSVKQFDDFATTSTPQTRVVT